MDAVRDLTQLLHRLLQLQPPPRDQLGLDGLGDQVRFDKSKPKRHRRRALLGTVVQVAFQPPPLGVAAHLDDASPRFPQLVGAPPKLGLQPGIGQRKPCRGTCALMRSGSSSNDASWTSKATCCPPCPE
jgi:hypothetical protein